MKSIILFGICLVSTLGGWAQQSFGIKAGVNLTNLKSGSYIQSSNRAGYMIGAYLSPKSKRMLGYRSEIIYSRQAYEFSSSSGYGSVKQDYLLLPQLTTINITRFVQLHLGVQLAFLINASTDSTSSYSAPEPYGKYMSYYNRFDYGLAGGVEFYPIKNLLLGTRFNMGLGDMYKSIDPGRQPSAVPAVNTKNKLLQVYAGWRF